MSLSYFGIRLLQKEFGGIVSLRLFFKGSSQQNWEGGTENAHVHPAPTGIAAHPASAPVSRMGVYYQERMYTDSLQSLTVSGSP